MIHKKHRQWLDKIRRVIHKGGDKEIKLLPLRSSWGVDKNMKRTPPRYEYRKVKIIKKGKEIGTAGFIRKPGTKNWTMDYIAG